MSEPFIVRKKDPSDVIIAMVGSPNVGKSTLFNALTGRNQHTGNWSGKTVSVAQGRYVYKGKGYILIDLPGTYSLQSQSEEEQVTTDFLHSGQADCTLIVTDATCLERTLLVALQVMDLTERTAVCVNLLDEAYAKGMALDLRVLERELGIPVAGTSAGSGAGLNEVREMLRNLSDGFLPLHPKKVLGDGGAFALEWRQGYTERAARQYSDHAHAIAQQVVQGGTGWTADRADRIVLGRVTGPIVLVLLLFGIFWLTIKGANGPSTLLQHLFDGWKAALLAATDKWPLWLSGILLDGVYHTLSCVISVMLPPLLIFFPLFSLLEDLGYLPRAAFLLDHSFERCGSCGKHALTMALGFGCNAVGVMGSRIITSDKERLLAIITNSLVPCNGRFPAMILLIRIFFSENDLIAASFMTMFVLISVGAVFVSSKILGDTLLYRKPSQMILELPPFRKPNLRKLLRHSLIDRTCAVLFRAVLVSAPAGAVIWLLQQTQIGNTSLLKWVANALDPVGTFLGMNGMILAAFLLSFPANELLIPSILMLMGFSNQTGASAEALGPILLSGGWTMQTALCTILFLLFHWPCSTTCLTIYKEAGSWKWALLSVLLPLTIGICLCSFFAAL